MKPTTVFSSSPTTGASVAPAEAKQPLLGATRPVLFESRPKQHMVPSVAQSIMPKKTTRPEEETDDGDDDQLQKKIREKKD